MFSQLDEIGVDAAVARVYEHGWQSWSPSTSYPVTARSARPPSDDRRRMSYRAEAPGPPDGFQGEGLLAVDTGAAVHVYSAADGFEEVPSIRASFVDGVVHVAANGPVVAVRSNTGLDTALAAWATGFAARAGTEPSFRAPPTVWCSWYAYGAAVTQPQIEEDLHSLGTEKLPVDVVQIDDGWQAGIGDWRPRPDRFASLDRLVERIRQAGRRAGIWVAPFLVGADSALAAEHPEWLIGGPDGHPACAGHNWGQAVYGLDATHPGAADHLRQVFAGLGAAGFDYVKLDFLYAGALVGSRHTGVAPLAAYRAGVGLIRDVLGPSAYLLGCGAPILPSVGLFDAMRVSADIAPHYEPSDGDPASPSQRGATLSTVGRAWQHGRFWVNDPDCLVAGPAVERRADWAGVVERYGGLRASSDRIADLDEWGLATTRRLLSTVPPPTPFVG